MKHGKKLKRAQKEILQDNGYNPEEWLLERDVAGKYVFVHRETEKTIEISK